MAAISLIHCFHSQSNSSIKHHNNINLPTIPNPLFCQNSKPTSQTRSHPEKGKDEENKAWRLPPRLQPGLILGKLGKHLKENMSPKQKGDWKDLILMSLSFAVYVYMSQKIVCAYCAWMSILK